MVVGIWCDERVFFGRGAGDKDLEPEIAGPRLRRRGVV
tara:strand:+ start:256 stop:369 length:114 start_codon:yes stop_codon:yes gene_type:complete